MSRRPLVICLVVIGALLPALVEAAAPPPNKSEVYVILKARLYEVDEAFNKKLAKAKWLSRADLEELEDKPQVDDALFAQLEKLKPSLVGKKINVDPGKEGVLLRATKKVECLPTPDQIRQASKRPQTFDEGFTLSAWIHVSSDRRFVRLEFREKSLEIEGVEQVKVVVDLDKGTEAVGEVVFTKEGSVTQTRYVPDAGSFLLPIHYRPRALRKNDRWLVAEITPRIYVEEEERERRGLPPK